MSGVFIGVREVSVHSPNCTHHVSEEQQARCPSFSRLLREYFVFFQGALLEAKSSVLSGTGSVDFQAPGVFSKGPWRADSA